MLGANVPQGKQPHPGLWRINLTGGDLRLLFGTDQTSSVDDPAYSPDGRTIAFTHIGVKARQDHGFDQQFQIWVIGSDGSSPRLAAPGRRPRWSKDGRYLAFDTQVVPGPPLAEASVDARSLRKIEGLTLSACTT